MKKPLPLLALSWFMMISYTANCQNILTTTYDTIRSVGKNELTPVVSATKMNVLYRGLENPVEISVPGKFDEVFIECTGGALSGENGKYIIKPGSEKKVIVSVFTIRKGKIQDSVKYYFRVKPVPTPQIVWCNRISGETIKGTEAGLCPLIPRMADFDFDFYTTIQSYDIAYSLDGKLIEKKDNKGNQIPTEIATEIKSLPSGASIFFTNVRILCPGGDTRISSAAFTIE